jgi:L-iditol 2-dehydrogenase
VVYHSNDDLRLEERPQPAAGPGELLVRVEASGICGSDVMEWYRRPRAPLVLGHEIAGVVAEAGDGVRRFAVGDRVVTTHHVPCGSCRYCETDRHSACSTLHETTFDPGGFAQFVRLPSINVTHGTFPLPDSVSFEEGTFVEPLASVVRTQRLAGLRAGDNVAVLGSGISGALHILWARAAGAGRILATDPSEWRRAAAGRCGADVAMAPAGLDRDTAREACGGTLPERVFICTGARAAMEQALDIVDDGGTVMFFAPLPPGEALSLDVNGMWKRGITLAHSYAGPPEDMRTALQWIAERRVDVGSTITHRIGLDRIPEGFRLVTEADESLKVIVEPWGGN